MTRLLTKTNRLSRLNRLAGFVIVGQQKGNIKISMKTNEWRVLLIGGNSGAGKTHLAKELVSRLGIPFLMVDDVRIEA